MVINLQFSGSAESMCNSGGEGGSKKKKCQCSLLRDTGLLKKTEEKEQRLVATSVSLLDKENR